MTMTPCDLVVRPRSMSTLPLTHLGFLALLLLCDTVDDGGPRLARRCGFDRLSQVVQQQVASETVDALLQQQAASPMAFDHAYITPFSVLDLTDMSPPTSLKIEGILSGVERPALSSRLIWMTQIATVLGHLHANGVVHGHVYPAVIRIKDDGNAMLTHTGAYTVASRVLHPYIQSFPNRESFAYSSPEFLKMDAPRVPTKAMDVYAFGSSLYTVLTGVAPFGGRHRRLEATIVEIGLHGHRRLLQPDGIGDGLWSVIRSCWEYDPANRPAMEYVVGALVALH